MAGKIPAPALDDAGTDFDDYKIRIDRWCQVSKVPKKHQALVIQGAMSKKPFGITKRIPMEVLKSDEGVKVLLKKLDEHYIPDKLQHTLSVWEKFMAIKRKHNEPMIEHITKFSEALDNFQDIDSKLACPDTIVAMLLLTSCNLSEEDNKIVKAQMEEPPCSKNLIGILKRVMTADKTAKELNSETESSDILITNASSDRDRATTSATFYARDIRRQNRPISRDRYECGRSCERGYRPERYERKRWSPERYERGRWVPYERDARDSRDSGERDRRKNPRGSDGQTNKCMVCKSLYHYVKDCPDVKAAKENFEKKNNDNKLHEKDHEVNLSW